MLTAVFQQFRLRPKEVERNLVGEQADGGGGLSGGEFRDREVAQPDAPHLPRLHQRVQGAHGLGDGDAGLRPVDQVEVDIGEPQIGKGAAHVALGAVQAATGIFPSDLFNTWNYGVTRRGRVVLFDYDDVIPIEQASFSRKPRTYDESEELAPEEDRIVATANDFFIDEMRSYSGLPQRLKGVFEIVHGDLFTVEFWRSVKEQVSAGELVDITPYDRAMKFRRA